eukprot:c5845_g1_i1 orf=283-1698(+)
MEEHSLIILEKSTIVPATQTERHEMYLPSLDLFWRDYHFNQRVLFYKTTAEEYGVISDALRRSLSEVMVYFYPWAGRLAVGEDGRHVIECNDAGVEFVEASLDVPFSEVESGDFQPKSFFKLLAQPGHNDGPLLIVQVTRFKNGEGVALGISHSHVVADGHSLWHFMVSWAECARGLPVSLLPIHDRTVLKIDKPIKEKAFLIIDMVEITGWPNKRLAQKNFHLTGEMLKTLKSQALQEGFQCYTSFELMCAHFWKCAMKSYNHLNSEKVHFLVMVNGRSRLNPPLPAAYFGNVVQCAVAQATVGELKKETLADTAARIHEIATSVCDETLRGMMHWLELNNNSFGGKWLATEGLMVSSSTRFPVYDVDYGWGRPAAVRTVAIHGEGELVLFAGREGGGSVDVCLLLEEDAMGRLSGDFVKQASHQDESIPHNSDVPSVAIPLYQGESIPHNSDAPSVAMPLYGRSECVSE